MQFRLLRPYLFEEIHVAWLWISLMEIVEQSLPIIACSTDNTLLYIMLLVQCFLLVVFRSTE